MNGSHVKGSFSILTLGETHSAVSITLITMLTKKTDIRQSDVSNIDKLLHVR